MTITAKLPVSTATSTVGEIMKKIIAILLGASLIGCTALRDRTVYDMELHYVEEALNKQNKIVLEYLKAHCCIGTEFVTGAKCGHDLDTYATVSIRTKYHISMMRYLGRIIETKPPIPKLKVSSVGLCE